VAVGRWGQHRPPPGGSRGARTRGLLLSALALVLVPGCFGEDLEVVAAEPPTTSTSTPATASSLDTTTDTPSTTTSSTVATTTTVEVTTTTTVATTTTESPTTTEAPPPPSGADASLAFINAKRADNGLDPLQLDPKLADVAHGWAHQLAEDKNLRHNPNVGDEIPNHYRTWGENVGYAGSPSGLDQAWWESDGHRANILGSNFSTVGIAFAVDENGTTWGVQVFAG
jgi:uncharacterized protein YkwD